MGDAGEGQSEVVLLFWMIIIWNCNVKFCRNMHTDNNRYIAL